MENLKHTKGEWEVTKEPFTLLITHKHNDKTESICQISERYKTTDEINANAKLIAAAPELLEALIELLHYVPVGSIHHSVLDKADSAINKATK